MGYGPADDDDIYGVTYSQQVEALAVANRKRIIKLEARIDQLKSQVSIMVDILELSARAMEGGMTKYK